MSWLTIHVASKGCLSWMAFQSTIKLRCTRMMRSIHHSARHWGILLHSNAIRIEECRCHLPMCHEHNFSWSSTKNSGILCWRHCSQESQQKQLPRWPENCAWYHAGSLVEDEPNQVILKSVEWQIPRIHHHIQRNSPWPKQSQDYLGHAISEGPQGA